MLLELFAPAKFGKTVTFVSAFPRGLCITGVKENVLLPAKTILNCQPAYRVVKTFADVTKIIVAEGKKYPEVWVDDLTVFGKNTEARLGRGWGSWNRYYKMAGDMIDALRQLDRPCAVNGHQRACRTTNGRFLRGGIDLSMDMTEFFTARVDYAGRGMPYEPDEPHPVYQHRWKIWGPPANPEWAVGNRLGLPHVAPANLGELLRATGLYRPDRLHNWQENVVQQVFEKIKGTPPDKRKLLKDARDQLVKKGIHPRVVAWTLRDAEDRYALYLDMQVKLLSDYDEEEEATTIDEPIVDADADDVQEQEEEKEEAVQEQ